MPSAISAWEFAKIPTPTLRNPSAASIMPLRISNRWVACLLPSRVSVVIVLVMLREYLSGFSVVFLYVCRITGSCSLINNHYCQTSAMRVCQALIFLISQLGSNRYNGGIVAKAAWRAAWIEMVDLLWLLNFLS